MIQVKTNLLNEDMIMELINITSIEESLKKEIKKQDGYFTKANLSMFLDCLKEYSDMNTIKIICCKDCSHYYEYDDWNRNTSEIVKCNECRILHIDFGPDGFCSLGESN